MKNPFRYLKDNWLKYGIETVAIVAGILGAFGLSTWQETRKEKQSEMIYLENLLVDLEGHLDNIEYKFYLRKMPERPARRWSVLLKRNPLILLNLTRN